MTGGRDDVAVGEVGVLSLSSSSSESRNGSCSVSRKTLDLSCVTTCLRRGSSYGC